MDCTPVGDVLLPTESFSQWVQKYAIPGMTTTNKPAALRDETPAELSSQLNATAEMFAQLTWHPVSQRAFERNAM